MKRYYSREDSTASPEAIARVHEMFVEHQRRAQCRQWLLCGLVALIVALICVVLFAVPAHSQGINLVPNPNFTYSLPPWSGTGTWAFDALHTTGGSVYLLNAYEDSATFNVDSNVEYLFSFQYGSQVGSVNNFTPILFFPDAVGGNVGFTPSQYPQAYTGEGRFIKRTYRFTPYPALGNRMYIEFAALNQYNKGIWVDSVVFEVAPQ